MFVCVFDSSSSRNFWTDLAEILNTDYQLFLFQKILSPHEISEKDEFHG